MTLHSPPYSRSEGFERNSDLTSALENINFTVRKGEFIVVLGRSGAGKSTLMRCINRLD